MTLKVLSRVGINADDTRCTGAGASHTGASGLRLYYDSTSRPSGFDATINPNPPANLFLHSDGTACGRDGDSSAGVTTKTCDDTRHQLPQALNATIRGVNVTARRSLGSADAQGE